MQALRSISVRWELLMEKVWTVVKAEDKLGTL